MTASKSEAILERAEAVALNLAEEDKPTALTTATVILAMVMRWNCSDEEYRACAAAIPDLLNASPKFRKGRRHDA
jgi:hypothetical protein